MSSITSACVFASTAAIALAAPLQAQTAAQASPTPPPRYEIRLDRSVWVPMRDGVRLSNDLYFPLNAGDKLPAILIRTPYNKNTYRERNPDARFFASQGYVVAVQDVRGRYASEGEYAVSAGDAEDGFDTDEWLAGQPWSNGRIGTFGCSYAGEVQIRQAPLRNPRIAAMIPQSSYGGFGSARGRYRLFGARTGGAVELASSVGWFARRGSKLFYRPPPGTPDSIIVQHQDAFDPAHAFLSSASARPGTPIIEYRKLWPLLPIIDIPRAGKFPPTDYEQYVSRDPADPWWNQFGYLTDEHRFDVPALHMNSWYDAGAAETLIELEMFRTNGVSQRARDNQFAIIDPGTHCNFENATARTIVGERNMGDARLDYRNLYLRWFDHWLRGVENGVTQMPKVQYYLMGKNEWRSAETWPVPNTRFTNYYLASMHGANSRFGDGTLDTALPTSRQSDDYIYDPATPVPSRGGALCCTGTAEAPAGSFDQSDIETRNDVLVYTSAPLSKGVEVTGPIRAVLYVSSTARDTDFTIKLVDVEPDGKAFNIQEGILRARYREGFDRKVFMTPGKVYRLEVDVQATSNYFAEGHQIRVEVSSSNFPRFDRNLNTGGNNYDEKEWIVARNTIHHSRQYPSHIVLPIVP